jgi:hypothetical protein
MSGRDHLRPPRRTPRWSALLRDHDRGLVAAAGGAWAASAGCTMLGTWRGAAVAACAATAAAALSMSSPRGAGLPSLMVLGIALGAATSAWHVRALRDGIVPRLAADHREVEVRARLVRDPVAVTNGSGMTVTDGNPLPASARR